MDKVVFCKTDDLLAIVEYTELPNVLLRVLKDLTGNCEIHIYFNQNNINGDNNIAVAGDSNLATL